MATRKKAVAPRSPAKRAAKPARKAAAKAAPRNTRAVIASLGAGRMGRGIAHAFAYAGHEVWLVDIKPRSKAQAAKLEREALADVKASLAGLAKLRAFPASAIPRIMKRIHFAALPDAPAALGRADVVFEGVPEVMQAKREAFAYAGPHLKRDAILASTTSTFLVTTLAGMVADPSRFLNAHFLNPAYLIPLVEVSPHRGTSAAALKRFNALLESVGKVPVQCQPAPGFLVPRFQSLIMNEAARMIEDGVATAEDIDRAIRYGFGFRYATMGVVEFIDFGGVDILWYAANYLADQLGERYRPPPIVAAHMASGRRGLREGRGFLDWRKVDATAYRRDALSRQLGMLKHLKLLKPPK